MYHTVQVRCDIGTVDLLQVFQVSQMMSVHWNFTEISAKYFTVSVISVYRCQTVTFFVDIPPHISQFCLFYTPNVSLSNKIK